MEITEVKEICKTYGASYASNDELIQLITGKKKIDQFTRELLDEYVRRNTVIGVTIKSPSDAVPLLRHLQLESQEVFVVLTLDGSNKVISMKEISKGTLNKNLVHPRDVLRECISNNAAAFIVCHNHPSGNTNPSDCDIQTTRTLKAAGNIVGIQLLDHIIIGTGYYSFEEHDCLGD